MGSKRKPLDIDQQAVSSKRLEQLPPYLPTGGIYASLPRYVLTQVRIVLTLLEYRTITVAMWTPVGDPAPQTIEHKHSEHKQDKDNGGCHIMSLIGIR